LRRYQSASASRFTAVATVVMYSFRSQRDSAYQAHR
jgi:hypothetical protein